MASTRIALNVIGIVKKLGSKIAKNLVAEGKVAIDIEGLNISFPKHSVVPPRVHTPPETLVDPGNVSPLEEVIYSDYAFDIEQPQLLGTVAEKNELSSLYFDYNANYNFYIRDYERILSSLPEEILPNLYVFLTEIDKMMRDPGAIVAGLLHAFPGSGVYYQHITLGGKIKDTLIDVVNSKGEKTGELDKLSYHEEWAKVLRDLGLRPAPVIVNPSEVTGQSFGAGQTLGDTAPGFGADTSPSWRDNLFNIFPFLNQFDNLVVPMTSIAYLLDHNEKRRMFPMYVEIDFNTDNNTQFADAFRKTRMGASLIREVMENKEIYVERYSHGRPFELGKTKTSEVEAAGPIYGERPWNRWMKMDRVSAVDPTLWGMTDGYYRYWNIGQFLMTTAAAALIDLPTLLSSTGDEDWMWLFSPTLSELEEILNTANNMCSASSLASDLEALREWMAKKVLGPDSASSPLARTYKEIYDGKQAYSETLFYRIEKRTKNGRFLQNIWLPNSSEIDVLKYIDTQVIYGVEYSYTVFAYQLVIGSKYRYKINNMPLCAEPNTTRTRIFDIAAPGTGPAPGQETVFTPLTLEELAAAGGVSVSELVFGTGTDQPGSDPLAPQGNFGWNDAGVSGGIIPTEPLTEAQLRAMNSGLGTLSLPDSIFTMQHGSFLASDWITFINRTFNANTFTEAYLGNMTPEITSNDPSSALNWNEAEICVFTEPSLVLFEVPQFTFNTVVIDKPPVAPDVNLIPYRGISNKILMFFNGNVGNYKAPFISLSNTDDELRDKYLLNQKLPSGGATPIEFKSDDPVTIFEIWRTDTKPTTWRDFNFHKRVDSSSFFSNPCKEASSASFTDDVVPNKKYWYTFRAVDVHNNISNPTVVYEVTMHDDHGTVWLDIETFPAPIPPDPRTPTKSCKKFIQIKPTFAQAALNEVESGFIDQATGNRIPSLATVSLSSDPPVLGLTSQNEGIWSGDAQPKKFKIRLTSKKTGRKMDFNVYFKTEHIKRSGGEIC